MLQNYGRRLLSIDGRALRLRYNLSAAGYQKPLTVENATVLFKVFNLDSHASTKGGHGGNHCHVTNRNVY